MLQEVLSDGRGQVAANRAVNVIVSIVVASILAAYLLPMAITELAAVDTSAWPAGAEEMWVLLPVMIVLAIFLFFVQVAVNTR